jgi:hypothetical protein
VERLIEQPTDGGDVLEGPIRLGRVRYHLSVYRHFSEADDQRISAALEVEGHITPVDYLDLTELHRRRSELRLWLADGRLLDFLMSNADGIIRSTGRGLYAL